MCSSQSNHPNIRACILLCIIYVYTCTRIIHVCIFTPKPAVPSVSAHSHGTAGWIQAPVRDGPEVFKDSGLLSLNLYDIVHTEYQSRGFSLGLRIVTFPGLSGVETETQLTTLPAQQQCWCSRKNGWWNSRSSVVLLKCRRVDCPLSDMFYYTKWYIRSSAARYKVLRIYISYIYVYMWIFRVKKKGCTR